MRKSRIRSFLAAALVGTALTAAGARGQPARPGPLETCLGAEKPAPRPGCHGDAVQRLPAPARNRIPPVPRFEDFPVSAGPPARNAPLVLTRRDMAYRTRLREAAAGRPDFAGHYVLAPWGCGTECLMGAAVDARTGRVTFLPIATCCLGEAAAEGHTAMVAFRPDSVLLVLIGIRHEGREGVGAHYYRIVGDRFVHLRSVPFASRR